MVVLSPKKISMLPLFVVFARLPAILDAVAKVASDVMRKSVGHFFPFAVKALVEERSLLTPVRVGVIHEGFKHVLYALLRYCARILLRGKFLDSCSCLAEEEENARKCILGDIYQTALARFLQCTALPSWHTWSTPLQQW